MGKVLKESTGGGTVHLWPTGHTHKYGVEMHPLPHEADFHGFFVAYVKAPNFDMAMAVANKRYETSHLALDTRS